ncbi:hypothetical protein DCAR_0314087 [Daucus carota subsp. sativus]|uniref:Serine/threonine-protein phosphatase n=1 Tax=Daucus carota subsp. sativus TaxID=79200 RepID=A0AAF0WRP0_DAUCS|nr:hypothetical protein DCAR_0314087 [Daucus carota subsp. sativus]
MGRKVKLAPAPKYHPLESFWDTEDDYPGPRCGHTLTAVAATENHGPRLILFGGATAIEGVGSGIRLTNVTNDLYSYDVEGNKWTRLRPSGEPPSPRAAHAAAAISTIVVFQGGVGASGQSNDDFYVLDLSEDKLKWRRLVIQGEGPGPRYGHVLALVAQRYLVCVSGNDGRRARSDAWALDTAKKPYIWNKINPEGDKPPARMYAAGCARWDGMLLICGGKNTSGTPLTDAYGLILHTNGQWEWTLAPGVFPSPRYQHAAAFVGSRLHITGGSFKGGREVDNEAASAVLDTAAGVWLDTKGPVTSSRTSKQRKELAGSLNLLHRCRHAAASVGDHIYIYGGFRADTLFGDFLFSGNEPEESSISSPAVSSERPRASFRRSPTINKYSSISSIRCRSGSPSSAGSSMDRNFMKKSAQFSAAEAGASSAVWKATQLEYGTSVELSRSVNNIKTAETRSDSSDTEASVRLHTRAVVVAKEAVGSLGGMVRQLGLDQLENESRRMAPLNTDLSQPTRNFTRQESSRGLHKKIISSLLTPRNWKPPANRRFFLDIYEIGELCSAAEQIFMNEPTVLQLQAPIKVFGDLHGQFGDLMRLFDEYGFPATTGDITYIDYLFLGDYVDRGQHSLETITLLLALKIQYPDNVYMIRGNHEAPDVNKIFGFRVECIERMGEIDGTSAWTRFNQLFNYLPLAALIDKKIICMHGGIGSSIRTVEQIEQLERPLTIDQQSTVLMDLLWSDPTENDSVEGLTPNARGAGLVSFGPDLVIEFCKRNNLQLILRAHECVMDGFERFAQGRLITVFSATNYCGTARNAGAILVVGRDLVIVPKLIHPLPPAICSSEGSPQPMMEDPWMRHLNIQRPPTPPRGRPKPEPPRNALAFM